MNKDDISKKLDEIAKDVRLIKNALIKNPGEWLSETDAAGVLDISADHLRRLRLQNKIPRTAYRKRPSGRGIQYKRSELERLRK